MVAAAPIVLNGVSATLGSVAAAGTTSFTVGTGEGAKFGTIGTNRYVPAVVVDTSTSPETIIEYVWITARATDTLTVTRAAEDAATYPAAAIAAGKTIAAVASATGLGELILSCLMPPLLDRLTGTFDLNYSLPGWGVPSNGAFDGGTGASISSSDMFFTPIFVARRAVFDRVAIRVTTAGVAGTVTRLGLYSSDSLLAPASLITDYGTVSSATTGNKEITISQTLGPGYYWIAVAHSNAVTCDAPNASAIPPFTTATWALGGNQPYISPRVSGTGVAAGSMPASAGTLDWSNLGNRWAAARLRYDRTAN